MRHFSSHRTWEWVQALSLQMFDKGLESPFCNGVWHLLVYWHQGISVSFIVTWSLLIVIPDCQCYQMDNSAQSLKGGGC